MNFTVKETNRVEDIAEFLASSILTELNKGKKVLFFVTGGSSVPIGTRVAKVLQEKAYEDSLENLTITLTDERYGEVNHPDSNWYKLMESGFDLKGAKLIPILTGDSKEVVLEKFNQILKDEFEKADYKVGLFGIGKDMHTAGILPESEAVYSKDFVGGYGTPQFSRITITPRTIEKLDEAVVSLRGEEKKEVIKNLEKENDINIEPAQILKKVPKLSIFTNFKTE